MPEPRAAANEITTETVKHLASLARISLTDEEIASLTTDLSNIVESVAKVSEVATDEVPPTSHPLPLHNVFRDDVVRDQLSQEDALRNAPDAAEGRFRVSAILGEEQ